MKPVTQSQPAEEPEFDCEYTDECVCPYCGHEQSDSWEIGTGSEEDGETYCGSCGKDFAYSRHIRVTYSTEPIMQKGKS